MKTKVNTKKKVSTKPKSEPLKQGAVSGSFSAEDIKYLIFYGCNKDKTVVIDEQKGHLDYAIMQMFLMMKESSRFDMDRVEKLFWERIGALANYR